LGYICSLWKERIRDGYQNGVPRGKQRARFGRGASGQET
jgi:hypothetical protein